MNRLELILSDQAREDLTEIWLYIAAASAANADRFLDLLFEKCHALCDHPEMGRPRDELLPGIRSFPVYRYVIFYRIDNDRIEIVRILSGYRDVESIL